MTTTNQPRTRRYEYRVDGRTVKPYADAGAATGESLPVYECTRCHRLVVWCTSRKTGRKYLAHTARHISDGMSVDSWWYNAGSVHTDEACQERQVRDAEEAARLDALAETQRNAAENTRTALLTCLAEAIESGDAEYVARVRRVMALSGVEEPAAV